MEKLLDAMKSDGITHAEHTLEDIGVAPSVSVKAIVKRAIRFRNCVIVIGIQIEREDGEWQRRTDLNTVERFGPGYDQMSTMACQTTVVV